MDKLSKNIKISSSLKSKNKGMIIYSKIRMIVRIHKIKILKTIRRVKMK